MNKPKIIYHEKTAIDLSRIKYIKLVPKIVGDTKRVLIQFNTRYEYVFNPNTGVYDKENMDDFVELKYDENEKAQQVLLEFIEIWQDYLDKNP
jgi:hypothetical protein